MPEIGPIPVTPPEVSARCLRLLARHDADDLAVMLGVADEEPVADHPQGDPTALPQRSDALDAADQAVRWLFYTSGTTADPKGAQHTDASIAAAARGMGQRLAVIDADRAALVFPFTHIGGVTWLFASQMFGNALILTDSFDPVGTPEVLSREGVTLAGAGTVFHQAYVAYQRRHVHPVFADVRAFPGGGAPKP